jgi:Ca2+-binding RTX toxin-like protein
LREKVASGIPPGIAGDLFHGQFRHRQSQPDGTTHFRQDWMGDWAYAPIVEMVSRGFNGTVFLYDYLTMEMAQVPGFPQLYFRVYGHFTFKTDITSVGTGTYVKDGSIINMIEVIDATGKVYSRMSGVEWAIEGDKTTKFIEPIIVQNTRFSPFERPEESQLMAGNDYVSGSSGSEQLRGFGGNDSLTGEGGIDALYGEAGDDTLDGGADADDLYGGIGNDTIKGYTQGDYIDGGDNFDTWALTGTWMAGGGTPPVTDLTAVTFYNIEAISISYGEIMLNSNQVGGASTVQTVYGGTLDRDMLRVVAAPGSNVINLSTVNFVNWNNWSGEFDIITIQGTAAADTIDGSMKDDRIFAYDGANTVRGGAGQDTIEGGAQADILRGGDGSDTITGGGGNDIIIADDDLAQFPTANVGSDSVYGGEGNDTIMALRGQNVINGGAGTDTVDYGFLVQDPARTQVPVHVLIDLSRTVDPNNPDLGYSAYIDLDYTEVFIPAVRDILVGVENVFGTAFVDRITGNGDGNHLSGRAGNDTLTGLGGNDTLEGGSGIDSLVGGSGNDVYKITGLDVIVEEAGNGTDHVRSSVSFALGANLEVLQLTGSNAINGIGNELANTVVGTARTTS